MPRKTKGSSSGPTHTESEDHPWIRNVAAHPSRTDSPEYRASRKLMNILAKRSSPFDDGPFQDHHAGGLWVFDGTRWFLFLNFAGIEWSMQFCCDPAKVDRLRVSAQALISRFPQTIPQYEALGYPAGRASQLLETPITDADMVAKWTDSIFNASVPLNANNHTGVLPKAAGEHHYPKPVKDGDYLKYDDFVLWQIHDKTQVAVTPVGRRGSGDGRVAVDYATPGSVLHKKLQRAHQRGKVLIVPPSHPLAKRAFVHQS
jgi:hypothetical protein